MPQSQLTEGRHAKAVQPASAAHDTQTPIQAPDIQDAPGLTAGQRDMLSTQRTLGNRAVLRQMQHNQLQRAPAAVQRVVAIDELTTGMTDPSLGTGASPSSISGPGGTVSVAGSGVSIDAAGPVTINGAAINMNAAVTEHTGIDKSDTVVTNSVVSAAYTPGAGNVW